MCIRKRHITIYMLLLEESGRATSSSLGCCALGISNFTSLLVCSTQDWLTTVCSASKWQELAFNPTVGDVWESWCLELPQSVLEIRTSLDISSLSFPDAFIGSSLDSCFPRLLFSSSDCSTLPWLLSEEQLELLDMLMLFLKCSSSSSLSPSV